MQINAQTRLSDVLDLDPRVVDYVVSLKAELFGRLYHPTMRRIMAKRVTVGRVAAMAQVPVQDVLYTIADLANVSVDNLSTVEMPQSPAQRPSWLKDLQPEIVQVLDLRPLHNDLETDLLPLVLRAVKSLPPEGVLQLIHMWEPQPLYDIWATMGNVEWFAEQVNENEWWIWVRRMPKEAI